MPVNISFRCSFHHSVELVVISQDRHDGLNSSSCDRKRTWKTIEQLL